MTRIKYLSHGDFVKVKQWTLFEAVDGDFLKQVRSLSYFRSDRLKKAKLIKEWKGAWENSKCICVDISSGETIFPL